MDNLAHSLFGAALARAGLSRRFGPGTTALLVVASNIPDIDIVLALTHRDEAAWLRRTHTHGILGGALLAILLGLVAWRLTKGRIPWRAACGLALLGVAGHVSLDLLNSYGVVLLYPFSHARFELAWSFIIDLAQWAILASPLLLARPLGRWIDPVRLARAALALYAAYLGACAAGHARAQALLDRHLDARAIGSDFRYVFPEAFGPHRWRGVARDDDIWRAWLIDVVHGRFSREGEVRTSAFDADVALLRTTPDARRVEWFAMAPLWTVNAERTRARCTDLRFRSLVLRRRGDAFAWEFSLKDHERVVRDRPMQAER